MHYTLYKMILELSRSYTKDHSHPQKSLITLINVFPHLVYANFNPLLYIKLYTVLHIKSLKPTFEVIMNVNRWLMCCGCGQYFRTCVISGVN